MKAKVGDRLVIKGHHVGEPDRDAEILEVHGEDGAPPFLVRWDDDGHEGLCSFRAAMRWSSTSAIGRTAEGARSASRPARGGEGPRALAPPTDVLQSGSG